MHADRTFGFAGLCALPFVAIALAGARPLHDVPGHAFIGVVLFAVALACAWRLGVPAITGGAPPMRTLALAGALLLAPWMLVGLLWTGLGAPFQADAPENAHRYVLLIVNALLVGAGFMVLRDALSQAGERVVSGAGFAASVPAGGLYVTCIAITLAQATMAVEGNNAPVPAILGHLYDVLEFFACVLTYLSTALFAVAMARADLLGRTASRAFAVACLVILVFLVLGGIEYPTISGQTAPWYTQPGVIVRIPAIPWLMPGLMGALALRRAGAKPAT